MQLMEGLNLFIIFIMCLPLISGSLLSNLSKLGHNVARSVTRLNGVWGKNKF